MKQKGTTLSPRVSIVVPTYNRGQLIVGTLEALSSQTLTDDVLEIVVVDDGSVDETAEIVSQWIAESPRRCFNLVVHAKNRGRSAACNSGIRATSAPYIIFTDDDCIPDADWAKHHLLRQEATEVATGVLGSVAFPEEWVIRSNFVRYFEGRYVGKRPWSTVKGEPDNLPPNLIPGMNVSFPRKPLLEVGMFNEVLGRGGDIEFAYRLWIAGMVFVYDSQAKLVHLSPEMVSFDYWLDKYLTHYDRSMPYIYRECPNLIEHFGHWYMMPPRPGKESIKRTLTKFGFRAICNPRILTCLRRYLVRHDNDPKRYYPGLYLYVIASSSLEKVKQLERTNML
ncbi:glycosyltransferase [Gemmatimonadota bacterium]